MRNSAPCWYKYFQTRIALCDTFNIVLSFNLILSRYYSFSSVPLIKPRIVPAAMHSKLYIQILCLKSCKVGMLILYMCVVLLTGLVFCCSKIILQVLVSFLSPPTAWFQGYLPSCVNWQAPVKELPLNFLQGVSKTEALITALQGRNNSLQCHTGWQVH